MPIQVLPPARDFASEFGAAIGGGLGSGFSQGFSNSLERNHEIRKIQEEYKNKNKQMALKLQGNKNITDDLEKERGLTPGSLSAYETDPRLAETVSRPKEKKLTQSSQPIDPEQLKIIKNVRDSEEFKNADPLKKYQLMTDANVSKENAQAEADIAYKGDTLANQKFESSYKAQEDFIDEVTKSYRAFETDTKPRLMQMQHMDPEDLIGPTANVFLESMGIPLGALSDPSSELYNKLSQDLLKGLPETYGSRILKVEVDNFLKTIPTLMNSPEGRRMISSNMLKLGEMKEIYYNEMRKQQKDSLDNSKPLPRDFQQRVFDQVKPQIDKFNDQFSKMAQIKHVPSGTIAFFDPDDNIVFVEKENAEWAQNNGGQRIW